MAPIPVNPTVLEIRQHFDVIGIDVSHNNGTINWETVKSAGVSFAYLKATEGLSWKDPLLFDNLSNASRAGLMVGLYHFYHPELNPLYQAQWFSSIITQASNVGTQLLPVVDLERDWQGSPDMYNTGVMSFRRGIVDKLRIYSSASYLNQWGGGIGVSDCSLWVPEYGVQTPKIPSLFSKWDMWQVTGSGSCPGVKGLCDIDVYNGTFEQLVTSK